MIEGIGDLRNVRAIIPALALALLGTACGSPQSGATSHPTPSATRLASSSPSPSASPTPSPSHVFVIVLENTSYQLALAQPYISTLASQYALATDYHQLANPSLPNYLGMTSGSTWGIRDDGYHQLPAT